MQRQSIRRGLAIGRTTALSKLSIWDAWIFFIVGMRWVYAWVQAYRDRDDVVGQSVRRHVTHDDEWCAEAFMQTDYSKIQRSDYEAALRKFVAYRIADEIELEEGSND